MSRCPRKCWPGYRRVRGKGCGKGSCVRRSYRMSKRRKNRVSRKRRKSRMKCNRVKRSYRPGKKFMVKACSRGREKLIHFGAKGYGHNYSKKARRSYRARHRCKTAKNKLTARYWSCKHSWSRGGSRKRCPKNRKCKK